MSYSAYFPISLFLFLGLLFSACSEGTETKEVDLQTAIQGNWNLKKAFRNKKKTVALENTFFEFQENGAMTTNFNLEMKTQNHQITVDNNIIRQQGPEKLTYHIYEVSDTSLTLQTRYQGYEFKLILEKVDQEGRE